MRIVRKGIDSPALSAKGDAPVEQPVGLSERRYLLRQQKELPGAFAGNREDARSFL